MLLGDEPRKAVEEPTRRPENRRLPKIRQR